MPVTRKKSTNPIGKYLWRRNQIGNMLSNLTYLGHVVNGKKEQINPKIKKEKRKKKDEYIIVENMHEAIINQETWDKVHEKLASFNIDNTKKYNHLLKDIIFCSECGSNTVIKHYKSKNKDGIVTSERNSIVCKKRNSYRSLCSNKPIGEYIIMKALKDIIKEEINKLDYSEEELKKIYKKTKKRPKKEENVDAIEQQKKKIKKIERKIEELYNKKLERLISTEEFKKEYQIITEERSKLNDEIKKMEEERNSKKEYSNKKEFNIDYLKIANEFLKMENPDIETIKKLVRRIEFDKEKNIVVALNFGNVYNNEATEYVISGEKYIKRGRF